MVYHIIFDENNLFWEFSKRISTEHNAAAHRRSGSFHDVIFDFQKRGVVSDEFDIIKVPNF